MKHSVGGCRGDGEIYSSNGGFPRAIHSPAQPPVPAITGKRRRGERSSSPSIGPPPKRARSEPTTIARPFQPRGAGEVESSRSIDTWLAQLPDIEPHSPTIKMDYNNLPPTPDSGTGNQSMVSGSDSRLNVQSTEYRMHLGKRNVYIYEESPPSSVRNFGLEIIDGERDSPEADDNFVQGFVRAARRCEASPEDLIREELGPAILPTIADLPANLTRSSNQQWTKHMDLAFDPSVLIRSPRLPHPKPDHGYGYHKSAFARTQYSAIDHFRDPEGNRYLAPESMPQIYAPCFVVEYVAQKNKGTHHKATSQNAHAGALTLRSMDELWKALKKSETIPREFSVFFSISMDHEVVRINCHWLKLAPNQPVEYHMAVLKAYLTSNEDMVRQLRTAIRNLVSYSDGSRREVLRKALDDYHASVKAHAPLQRLILKFNQKRPASDSGLDLGRGKKRSMGSDGGSNHARSM